MKIISVSFVLLILSACSTVEKVQYATFEKIGVHKREILVDRIEKTSRTQEQAKTEFKSAYQQLAELVALDDDGLEEGYKKLKSSLNRSEKKADELNGRIASVDKVAAALFEEWQGELEQYQNIALKERSQQNLITTQNRYHVILSKMRHSQNSIEPVLRALQDNTLFLKHNLNARAINGLTVEVQSVQDKVRQLITEMEASISESSTFIQSMQGGNSG